MASIITHDVRWVKRRGSRRPRAADPFWALVATARRLQAPGGCPWDRAQTVRSLLPYLAEEAWEVFDAARSRRQRRLEEELGDLLYTVLFLALIAERHGTCRLTRLLRRTRAKMVRRHPHVFGPRHAAGPHEAFRRWEESKQREGPRGPSPSRAFRQALVSWWEYLRRYPDQAPQALARLGRLTAYREANGLSTRPSATRPTTSARSRARGGGSPRGDR